VGIIRTPNQPI